MFYILPADLHLFCIIDVQDASNTPDGFFFK